MAHSTLTVPEMSCDACRATITGALDLLPGVASVTVDLEGKLVTVEHDDDLAPVDRPAAIEEQGYEVAAG
jgi:copper chaperone